MLKRLNSKEILFVDTEATCWGDKTRQEQQRDREIIEIGIAKVDVTLNKIVDKEYYVIKNIHSEVSDYCVNLTGITQELIDKEGVTLGKAMKEIKQRFGSKNKTWLTWGSFDYNFVKGQCEKQNAEFVFTDNIINLADLYAMFAGISRSRNMLKAMNKLNIQMEGERHRALPDAIATARIFLEMKKRTGIDI